MIRLSFLLLFFGRGAFADNNLVSEALETKVIKNQIVATLKAGFHFNEKAPNGVVIDDKKESPLVLSRQKITFALPKIYSLAQASVFVCDDAVTFCEPRTVEFRGNGEANQYMVARAEMKRAQSKDMKKKLKPKLNKHGFYEDALDFAAEMAAKSKSLILADFSARWCPGCVRLENEIFETREFKNATKNFVKVKMDYDRFENLPLKAKFAINGIPTLLVLNSKLEEVSRIVDFQPLDAIVGFLKESEKTPGSITSLKAVADAGDSNSNLTLALRLYSAGRYAESLPYFAKVTPEPIEAIDAKVRAAKKEFDNDSSKKSNYLTVAHDALVKEPNSTRSLVWRTDMAEALSSANERTSVALEGIKVADDLLAHPEKIPTAIKGDWVGEFSGYERFFVAIERADLIEAAQSTPDEIHAAREKVVAIGKELKIPVSKKGPSLRLVVAMAEAQAFTDGEAQIRKMQKADPKNPELDRRLIKMLNGEGKFAEAVNVGRKAISKSYGKNEIWTAVLLAKAYVGNKQALEARALARSYLDRDDIDWTLMPKEQKELHDLVQANL